MSVTSRRLRKFSLSRRVTGCAVCLFFIGLMYTGAVLRPVLPLTGECTVEGTAACDFVLREDDTVAGYLENVTLTSAETSAHIDRVYWTFDTYGEEAAVLPAEGELVRFGGRVYAPSGQSNPYGFDFRMYLLQKNTTCGVTVSHYLLFPVCIEFSLTHA